MIFQQPIAAILAAANVWTASQTIQGATGASPSLYAQIAGDTVPRLRVGLNVSDVPSIAFGSGAATRDLFLERAGPANLRLGGSDSATPTAQTFSMQNALAGSADIAGPDFTIQGALSTGTGGAGRVGIATSSRAASTATTQNAAAVVAWFGPNTLTGSQAIPLFDLAVTWNTSGSPTAIKANVTNTASNAASLLFDLQKNATSQFKVDISGNFTSIGTTNAVGTITSGVWNAGAVTSSGAIQAGSAATLGISTDVLLVREAAATLALRNATTAQAFRVYNTYTDASNYEGATFDWTTTANTLSIGTTKLGTGSIRNVAILVGSAVRLTIANNSVTFGAASSTLAWTTRSILSSPADGQLLLTNNAATGFTSLQFGGTTDSFGAVARDGAGIKIVGGAGGSVSWIRVPGVAVSALPSAATAGAGARAFVTDATAPTWGMTVAGGGSTNAPVYSDGTNWKVG